MYMTFLDMCCRIRLVAARKASHGTGCSSHFRDDPGPITFDNDKSWSLQIMVPRGLEPRTLRLLAVRSNQLSYETIETRSHTSYQELRNQCCQLFSIGRQTHSIVMGSSGDSSSGLNARRDFAYIASSHLYRVQAGSRFR